MSYAYTSPDGKREVFAGSDFMDTVRAKSGQGPDPHPFGLNPKYELNANRYSGLTPPKLSKEEKEQGYRWLNVGTRGFQTSDPASGSTNHHVPIWERSQIANAAAKEDKPAEQPKTDPPSFSETPISFSQDTLDARDRAQTYLDGEGGGGRSSLDVTASGGQLLQNIYNEGSQRVDDYQRRFLPYLQDRAMATAGEIGDSVRQHASRFEGKVTDLMGSQDIKRLFEYYSGKVKKA